MDTYMEKCMEILNEVRSLPTLEEPVTLFRLSDTCYTRLCVPADELLKLCRVISFTLLEEQITHLQAIIYSKDFVVIKFIPPSYNPAVLLDVDIINKVESLYLLT